MNQDIPEENAEDKITSKTSPTEETITALDKEIDEMLASLESDSGESADSTAAALAEIDLDDLF